MGNQACPFKGARTTTLWPRYPETLLVFSGVERWETLFLVEPQTYWLSPRFITIGQPLDAISPVAYDSASGTSVISEVEFVPVIELCRMISKEREMRGGTVEAETRRPPSRRCTVEQPQLYPLRTELLRDPIVCDKMVLVPMDISELQGGRIEQPHGDGAQMVYARRKEDEM